MIAIILFTIAVSAVTAITDPTHLCDEISTLDCKTTYTKGEQDETVCGVNGVTYDNFCYYSKARCNDKNIYIAKVGSCSGITTAPTTPTTAAPMNPVTTVVTGAPMPNVTTATVVMTTQAPTQDPILAAFCQNKDAIQCGTDLSPICGSDKQFYLNKCEYSKAYCSDNSLTSKDISFCTGGR